MRFLKRLVVTAILLILVPSVVASAAYGAFGRPSDGRVAPRVLLTDTDVSRFDAAMLDARIADLATDYRDETIKLIRGGRSGQIPAPAFGMTVLTADTREAAMEYGRTGNVARDVVSWVASFVQPRRVEVSASIDASRLERLLVQADPGPRIAPTEPRLEYREGALRVIEGAEGSGLTADSVSDALGSALTHGKPIVVKADVDNIVPTVGSDEIEAIAAEANNRLTPLPVKAGAVTGEIPHTAYGPFIRTAVADGELTFFADSDPSAVTSEAFFPTATKPPVEPRFTIARGDRPVIVPGQDGQRCCDPAAKPLFDLALAAKMNGAPVPAPVELPTIPLPPVTPVSELEGFGIKEPIGTFTTRHPAGQPRVRNIHRIADTVQGTVIKPGDTFSLNGFVGPRTVEKGYVADSVIVNGKFEKSVGGGISQFATTLFNAGFFGGLDFGEYQAHTIYIERYPYGREATISHPHPDLQIKNTTPHGVLIWPSYTNTQITVTLYSTPYARGAQTGQTTSRVGNCTRVRTERTRTYIDGRTTVDAVFATYQPEEGVLC